MRRFCICVILVWALVPHSGWAQTSSTNLSGTVKDTSGGVLPGVAVTARNVATNDTRTATTAIDGLYRLTNLSRGTYEVSAELEGYNCLKNRMAMGIGGVGNTLDRQAGRFGLWLKRTSPGLYGSVRRR